MCTDRDGECDGMGSEWEENVSWEESRSVIQLCARQEENEEKKTEKQRSGKEKERTHAVNTWRGEG